MEYKWVQRFLDGWTFVTIWIYLSLLWAFSSIFIITYLPATIAVTAAMRRADDGYAAVTKTFFYTLVDRAFGGVVLGIPFLVIVSLSWVNVQIMISSNNRFLAVIYLGVLVFFNVLLAGLIVQSVAVLAMEKQRIRVVLSMAIRSVALSSMKTLSIVFLIMCLLVISIKVPLLGVLSGGALIGWLILKLTPGHSSSSEKEDIII